MPTMLVMITAMTIPILLVVALLLLTGWIHRSRDEAIARQVMVTDAIHRELGPIVSPVVKKRLRGPWQVFIAVPLARPAVVEKVVAIAHRAVSFPGEATAGRVRIVLTAQEGPPRTTERAAVTPRSERESVSWT